MKTKDFQVIHLNERRQIKLTQGRIHLIIALNLIETFRCNDIKNKEQKERG